MAGKRLLDAAKLISAGSGIAKQHWTLRRQQWDHFTKTSGIGKTLKQQTDRVTVTAQAARTLVDRLDETGPSWQSSQTPVQDVDTKVWQEPQAHTQDFAVGVRDVEKRLNQHEEVRTPTLQSHASAPLGDDGTLSSLRKRELQRMAERHIPEITVGDLPEGAQTGRDTFDERPRRASLDLSSLPRSKLPKHSESSQSSDGHINADVFPSPQPAEVDTNIFHSQRVSDMLGQASRDSKNPYAHLKKVPPKPLPEMVASHDRLRQQPVEPVTGEKESVKDTADASRVETHDLASAIADDVQASSQSSDPLPDLRESRIPESRFGRLWQYGGLATSMAFGAVGESFRRLSGGSNEGSLVLSEANMNRLVAKLSRMRGAALKLGQMMSFQDSKVLPATINQVLQRVQDSADYMPPSQRNQVMARSLGDDWRSLFSQFEERPFAAASIGQVHRAKLASNGKDVAVKVQYPGVRNSIDSDLNNLSLLLTASRLLPKGLYLDKTIANARTELGWECDYEREAKSCIRFAELVRDEADVFAVPTVFTEASGRDVLTAEFMNGKAVTKIPDLSQDERDWIGTQILRLCLRELMEWRFMQTDPNWTNFLYNRQTRKLELLDFGASRDFPDAFVEPYVALLIAASRHDREACREFSIQLGYLTGHESSAMLQAHIDSILTLAEPFVETAPEVYEFEDQTITDRVRANIGVMLRERLAPPPEETYSLHRKLSGAFLLCARLKSRVRARDMFSDALRVWNGRADKITSPKL